MFFERLGLERAARESWKTSSTFVQLEKLLLLAHPMVPRTSYAMNKTPSGSENC